MTWGRHGVTWARNDVKGALAEPGVSWDGFELDCFDLFEVFAVVGEDDEVVVKSGASD